MLSERDQRILREIEQHLEADHPQLAASLQRHAAAERRARLRHDVAAVLAAVLGLTCLLLPGAATAGLAAATLAAVAFGARVLRFPTSRPAQSVRRIMGHRGGHPQRRPGQGTSI